MTVSSLPVLPTGWRVFIEEAKAQHNLLCRIPQEGHEVVWLERDVVDDIEYINRRRRSGNW